MMRVSLRAARRRLWAKVLRLAARPQKPRLATTRATGESYARSGSAEHLVLAGDTIERIADKYKLTTRELRRANDLWVRPLRVGEKLIIAIVPYLRSDPPRSHRVPSKAQ